MANLAVQPKLRDLQKLYTFRGDDKVAAFLEKAPFLAPLLLEFASIREQYFPGSQAALEVETDREINSDELLMFIIVNDTPDIAFTRLMTFDDEWWVTNYDRAKGKLSIHLEFT